VSTLSALFSLHINIQDFYIVRKEELADKAIRSLHLVHCTTGLLRIGARVPIPSDENKQLAILKNLRKLIQLVAINV
jgi:hypothetical protein